MSKISIIIPVYNVENYIKECLESVINQTLKDIEIICINDCGTDNSMSIVEEYALKDSRIKIINLEHNKGVGPARNTGIKTATGKYIIFLDSDDYFEELNILEKLYKKATITNADFVMVKYDKWHDEFIDKLASTNNTLTVTLKNFNKVLSNFNIVVWGKLFKTQFLRDNKLEFINSKAIHEDDGFTLKLLSVYPTYTCVSDKGVFYRKNPNSIMNTLVKEKSKNGKKDNIIDAFNYIKNHCKDAKKIIRKIKYSYRYSIHSNKCCKLFRFNWQKYDKHLEILFISIIKSKIIDDKLVTKIFGIKINTKVI